MGGDGRTAAGRQAGRWEADGRTGGRGAKERRTGGRGADGWTSDRADGRTSTGFKRPRTLFPASLSSTQTTCLIAERVCRVLGSALGSQLGLCYFFFCSEQHICNSGTTLL